MISRALDTDGDWTFGRGKNNYLSESKAIEQNIRTRLHSFLGDCFFDLASGIDWFSLLGSKNKLALRLNITTIILNTPGVTEIVALSVDVDNNRHMSISYTVKTVYTGTREIQTISVTTGFLLDESGNILTTEDGDQFKI